MTKKGMTINSAVRIEGVAYGPGQEDELQEKLTADQHAYLVAQGAIEGGSGNAAAPKEQAASQPKSQQTRNEK